MQGRRGYQLSDSQVVYDLAGYELGAVDIICDTYSSVDGIDLPVLVHFSKQKTTFSSLLGHCKYDNFDFVAEFF